MFRFALCVVTLSIVDGTTFRIPFGETAMNWQETDPMFERHHFAQDLASGQWTMTELCTRYGMSRNTGHKWRERFLSLGVRGLEEQSRAPLSSTPLLLMPDGKVPNGPRVSRFGNSAVTFCQRATTVEQGLRVSRANFC